jgi:hypothetical protein
MDAARCADQLSVCGSRKKGDLDGNFDFKRNPRTICHVFDNFLTRLFELSHSDPQPLDDDLCPNLSCKLIQRVECATVHVGGSKFFYRQVTAFDATTPEVAEV